MNHLKLEQKLGLKQMMNPDEDTMLIVKIQNYNAKL